MSIFKTKNCWKSKHPEVILNLDDASEFVPTWLIEYFDKAVSEGRRFRDGETVQIGWMTTLLKENSAGEIEVWEPQFDSIPIKWTRGINNTVRHSVLQKSVAKLVGCEPNFPSIRQAGLASPQFLASQNDFEMTRLRSSNNDSGWRFSDSHDGEPEGEWRSLFELAFHQMLIVPFLALPEKATVTRAVNEIVITFEDKEVSSQSNDLLRHLTESPILI